MDRKKFRDNCGHQAMLSWQYKVKKLNELESRIEAEIMQFMDLTGVNVKDIQLYDPRTGQVQLETDL